MGELDFLIGRSVVEIRDETRIVFVAGSRLEPDLYADVGDYELIGRNGASQRLSSLLGRRVSGASAEGGTLRLSFDDDSSLVCEPDPQFEAWQIVGGHPQALVVCDPGGDLTIFDSTRAPTPGEVAASVRRLNEWTGWNVELDEVTEDGKVIVRPPDQHDR